MGEGRPVVVLHGGPGAQHDYLVPAFRRLSDRYRLYFYDQRGGGRSLSSRRTRIGWREHVSDLERLRVDWGLERLTMLGYSWGGLLALLYAEEHPQRVGALVLISPAAGWGNYHRRFQEELARRARSEPLRAMRAALEASALRERDPAVYAQRRFELSVAVYFRDPRESRDSPRFVVRLQSQRATWTSLKGYEAELRRRVATLTCPVLVLHGRHDPLPLQWAEELVATLPEARLVVLEESGHVPYVEEAERTFSEIRRFLEDQAQ